MKAVVERSWVAMLTGVAGPKGWASVVVLVLAVFLLPSAVVAREQHTEIQTGVANGAGPPVYLQGVVTVEESSVSDDIDIKVAEARCPRGTWVIGGNAELASTGAVDQVNTLVESRPLDLPAQGWLAIGYETFQAAGEWAIQVTAICAVVPDVQRVELETATSSTDAKDLTAVCPAGTRVLGGGGQVIGPLFPTDLTLSASWPSDNLGTGWEARGVEWTPTAISWRLRVIALCANIANPYQVIIGRALGFVETLLLIAECPADTLAIGGGGGRMDTFPSERIFLQHIFTDTMLDSSKTIAGFRTLSNIGFTGDARAICIVPYVFGDGLESGDTSAWSGTQ